jgi:serine/threonine protein kinase
MHHRLKMVHMDVKCNNILVDVVKRQAYLCDFGLSASTDDIGEPRGTLGTPSAFLYSASSRLLFHANDRVRWVCVAYSAPELRDEHAPASTLCDMFSLGVVLLRLIMPYLSVDGDDGCLVLIRIPLAEFDPLEQYSLNALANYFQRSSACVPIRSHVLSSTPHL